MALSTTLRGLVPKLLRDPPYTNHTTGGGAQCSTTTRSVVDLNRNLVASKPSAANQRPQQSTWTAAPLSGAAPTHGGRLSFGSAVNV